MTRTFDDYIARATAALERGFSTKAARKDAIDAARSAYEIATGEITAELLAEPRNARRIGFDELYYGLPDLHVWKKKKHSEMFRAFSAAVAKIEVAVALRAKIVDAPEATKTPTKKAIENAARLAVAKICQICGRPILAETGVIAHHGYTRPGDGYQTSSCFGARELPFEVSRDALGRYIVGLEGGLAQMNAARKRVATEELGVRLSYRVYNGGWKGEDVYFSTTRKTFAAARAEYPKFFSLSTGTDGWTYDDALRADLRDRDAKIVGQKTYIKEQKARFDAWKPVATEGGAS